LGEGGREGGREGRDSVSLETLGKLKAQPHRPPKIDQNF